ncbi:MAG: hypothetical protein KatS3mg111_3567 [Pirellulaceae bacterium]|nr:MAG: hypothetical protein KatS3mg111_3567 [Pirellulaceae bacterium]
MARHLPRRRRTMCKKLARCVATMAVIGTAMASGDSSLADQPTVVPRAALPIQLPTVPTTANQVASPERVGGLIPDELDAPVRPGVELKISDDRGVAASGDRTDATEMRLPGEYHEGSLIIDAVEATATARPIHAAPNETARLTTIPPKTNLADQSSKNVARRGVAFRLTSPSTLNADRQPQNVTAAGPVQEKPAPHPLAVSTNLRPPATVRLATPPRTEEGDGTAASPSMPTGIKAEGSIAGTAHNPLPVPSLLPLNTPSPASSPMPSLSEAPPQVLMHVSGGTGSRLAAEEGSHKVGVQSAPSHAKREAMSLPDRSQVAQDQHATSAPSSLPPVGPLVAHGVRRAAPAVIPPSRLPQTAVARSVAAADQAETSAAVRPASALRIPQSVDTTIAEDAESKPGLPPRRTPEFPPMEFRHGALERVSQSIATTVGVAKSIEDGEVPVRVAVRDEEICQATVVSRSLLVVGVRPGKTEIAVLSQSTVGKSVCQVYPVEVQEDSRMVKLTELAQGLTKTLSALHPNGQIIVSAEDEQLVVSGVVATDREAREILQFVRSQSLHPVIDRVQAMRE